MQLTQYEYFLIFLINAHEVYHVPMKYIMCPCSSLLYAQYATTCLLCAHLVA